MLSIFQSARRFSSLRTLNKKGLFEEVIKLYPTLENKTESDTREYYRALKNKSISYLSEDLPNDPDVTLNRLPPNNSKSLIGKLGLDKNFSEYLQFLTSLTFFAALGYIFMKKTGIEAEDFKFEKVSNIKFKDVRGIDEYREELEDIVDFLKNHEKYSNAGVKVTKGILLTGRPGTGKTLLAKAIAGEAGVNFLQTSGSNFEEKFVGLGPSRVRKLFEQARNNAPCIIFIDEIDSVAQSRNYRSANYSKDSLNQLLVEMDGFQQNDRIIVIGATNFPESIDKALMRSGRFDKTVDLPVPDRKARTDILSYYISKIKADETVDINIIVSKTQGMTGAELENLVNIAALHSVKMGQEKCSNENFDYAYDRITLGLQSKTMSLDKHDLETTVYHELGHAVVAHYTKGAGQMHKITILPRGPSLGHTSFLQLKEDKPFTKEEILAHIDVCMGGRAAEEFFFGEANVTTGCSSDLKSATNAAYMGVRSGLFTDITGVQSFDQLEDLGNDQRNKVDRWVLHILDESYKRAKKMVEGKVVVIRDLAKELKEKETLTREQFTEIANKY